MDMKILNLYAGIGGNRKLWDKEHDITAVENVKFIADTYRTLYPQDTVIEADAHQYLLDHFQEYDLIWSSPPCPTHSRASTSLKGWGIVRYPDMALYQEIILLKNFYKGDWIVENVIGYYEPLIKPTATVDRHYVWSNLPIQDVDRYSYTDDCYNVNRATKEVLAAKLGITLPEGTKDQRKLLRNAVNPLMGKYILDLTSNRPNK